MKKSWFILTSIIISLLVMLFSGSLQIMRNLRAHAPLDEFKAHMDERIPALMKLYGIPGCNIALVKDNEVVWTEGYGYADVSNRRALTVDTPMSVQSITKSVTAWGVMRLWEKGLIDVDAPVSQYLKSWQFPLTDYRIEKITVRQLLSHTAGMPLGDFTNIYSPGEAMPSNRDVMSGEAVLMREPGTGFSYSNTGYNLLEILIEDVTGQSFSDYIRREVLLPLGMESAVFDIDKAVTPYPPTGYNLKGEPVPVYLYPSKASGGLFATAHDIARFAASGMQENPVLSIESINRMYKPESYKIGIYGLVFEAYGFGHYIEKLPNGMVSVSHGGQGNGIMTHMQAVPETGDAIVILTNSQRSWPFIAYVLSNWAQWRGFPSVGMGRIIWGHYGFCFVIGMLVSASLLVILSLVSTFYQQKRAGFRLLRVSAASILLGILIWCACQEYLFITSVFPILSVWLGGAAFVFSIVLLLSVVLPQWPRKYEE
ncbi:MAG: beta-lactamase family protein [Tissierellia bacterium]|jgi:CubicO group peptidase (beta-lactamase class C family)|nr:beta-lactamase family protein [Prolixibacteraceae bacterium]NLA13446.1 beta-lactamase family protein [Tissierellia bacterium]HQO72087.1 serine hydrolase domain-containing protein [Sedimentibacter sp.]